MTYPNIRTKCEFKANFRKLTWNIHAIWTTPEGEICWLEGKADRKSVTINRTFSPDQIKIPKHIKETIDDRCAINNGSHAKFMEKVE